MKSISLLTTLAALLCNISPGLAQSSSATSSTSAIGSCPTVLTPLYEAPVVGSGWTAQLIVNNVMSPRGILFDQNGGLLVVQQGWGIVRVTFNDYGGTCLVVNETTTVVENSDLNHSLQLSADGLFLYASTSNEVYRWPYNATVGTVGENETLVTNMSNTDHVTRTLLLPQKVPNTLLVARGSSENMDLTAAQLNSGHSQVRAFDICDLPDGRPYDYPSEGKVLGWGLRNSVGVAEHPVTGGIYTVENSADQVQRNGTDIHEDNPGEEMNFLGILNGSTEDQGGDYGYPNCFALWSTDDFPDLGNLTVGSQFALNLSDTFNDTTCAQDYIPPRLTFQAHTAPLDILFSPDGSTAYVTFHGSWDRTQPAGYGLSSIQFDKDTGEPVAPADSTTATANVIGNADLSLCPSGCFRPVGLAWDGQGRLFMSSDSTGEIYVLQQADFSASGGGVGGGDTGGAGAGTGGGTTSATGPVATSTSNSTSNSTSSTTSTSGSTSAPTVVSRSDRNRPGGETLWLAACLIVVLSSLVGG